MWNFPEVRQNKTLSAVKIRRTPSLVTVGGAVTVPVASQEHGVRAHALNVRQRVAIGVGALKLQAPTELPSNCCLQRVIHRETIGLDAMQASGGKAENGHALERICHGVDRNSIHGMSWTGEERFVRVASRGQSRPSRSNIRDFEHGFRQELVLR